MWMSDVWAGTYCWVGWGGWVEPTQSTELNLINLPNPCNQGGRVYSISLIFDVFTGKFEDDLPEDIDFSDYIQIVEAEKEIAIKMINQRLDKISEEDYKESTD
jgi:hypothetical protein